jgi:hypothetical protein
VHYTVRIFHGDHLVHEEVCNEERAIGLVDSLPPGDDSISIELPGELFLDLFETEEV